MKADVRRALNILVATALVGWLVAVVVTYWPVRPLPSPELKPRGGPVYFLPLGAPDPPFLDSVAMHLEQRYPLRVIQSSDRRNVMFGPILGLRDLDSIGEDF